MLFSLQGSGTSPPRFAVADSLFIHEMGLCLLMSESPKTSFKWFNFPDNCSFTWSSVNQQTVIQSGLTTSLTKYLFLEECHAIRSSSRSSSHCNEMVRNARKAKRGLKWQKMKSSEDDSGIFASFGLDGVSGPSWDRSKLTWPKENYCHLHYIVYIS